MSRRTPAAPLLLLALGVFAPGCAKAAAGEAEQTLVIAFEAAFRGAPLGCATPTQAGGATFALRDLRFFVHDVRLLDESGHEVAAKLVPDGRWQSEAAALLDFEDGTGACDSGTRGTNTHLMLKAPAGAYTGLRFRLGLPFVENHQNPALAAAPLSVGSMHWGWQGGYKFMRLEGKLDGAARRIHLGSTGCEGTIGHIQRCARPHRPEITLRPFVSGQSTVVLDVDALLDAPRGAGDEGCMSGAEDQACARPFAAVGLSLTSGESVEEQHAFQLR